jgi:DHA1 family multidrug resistance protein-like MFS transporter
VAEISGNRGGLATVTGLISGGGALASAVGAYFLGRASDRIGQRKMLLWCTFGIALTYVPQAAVSGVMQLASLQLASGFLMAGVLASFSALLARFVPGERHGTVYGISSTTVAVANALGPLIGAGAAVWWGLRSVFLTTAFVLAVAGGLAWWLFSMPTGEAEIAPQPFAGGGDITTR